MDGTCVEKRQACSDHCSGRGSCYWAGIATGLQVADCAVSDLSCEPVCNCTGTSFTGTACELSADDLKTRQSIRGQLFQSLKALTLTDDVSEETVRSWTVSLVSVTKSQFEIPYSEGDHAYDIVDSILGYAEALQLESSAVVGVLSTIDQLCLVYEFNYEPTDLNNQAADQQRVAYDGYSAARLATVLRRYANLTASRMVPGQASEVALFRFFQMSTEVRELSSSAEAAFDLVPQTGTASSTADPTITSETTFVSLVGATNTNTQQAETGTDNSGDVYVAVTLTNIIPRAFGALVGKMHSEALAVSLSSPDGAASSAASPLGLPLQQRRLLALLLAVPRLEVALGEPRNRHGQQVPSE